MQEVTGHLKEKTGSENFDFLVNNAGIQANGLVADTTGEAFDNLYQVHLKGTFFLTQKALPFINNHGLIINVSSGLARFSTLGYAAYAAMKGAVEIFKRPGLLQQVVSNFALGRIGQPEDIGGVAAFLCTEDARWITAQRIEASGGMFL